MCSLASLPVHNTLPCLYTTHIQAVLGPDRMPSAEDLAQMKYLNAVVKEILRMWPAAGTARMAPPGSTLQVGK